MTQHTDQTDHRVAFVCVQNAGRSQMTAAFAERERDRRDASDRIGIVPGGTRPDDPHERSIGEVRAIRDEIEARGVAPFDELPSETPPAE